MAELIGAFVEAVVSLVMAVLEALPAILEALFFVVAASITIIAYVVSPRYREKKRQEWTAKPGRKYLELGISSLCLLSIVGLTLWLFFPSPPPPVVSSGTVRVVEGSSDEDMRLKLKPATKPDTANEITIAVKRGGMKKLIETDSINELKQAIRENITVIKPSDNSQQGDGQP